MLWIDFSESHFGSSKVSSQFWVLCGRLVNLGRCGCKGYTSVVLGYSEATLLKEGEDASFCPSAHCVWLYPALQCRSSMPSNSVVFHTSRGISSSPAAFLNLLYFHLSPILAISRVLELLFSFHSFYIQLGPPSWAVITVFLWRIWFS